MNIDFSANISLSHLLAVAALVFCLGVGGLIINRKNLIHILMSIELMLLGVNINLIAFSVALKDLNGQIFSIFILSIAAAEAAIGLAIVVNYFRHRNSIDVKDIRSMRG